MSEVYAFSPKPNKYILHYLYISPTGDPREINGMTVEPIGERLQFQYYKKESDFQPQQNPAVLNDFNIDIVHHWYEGVQEEPYRQEISSTYTIKQRQTPLFDTREKTQFIDYLKLNKFPTFTLDNIFISTPRIHFNGDTADPEHAGFIEQRVEEYVEEIPLNHIYGNLLNVIKQIRYRTPTNNAQRAALLSSGALGKMMEYMGPRTIGGKKTNKRYRRKNKSRRRKHKSHRRKHKSDRRKH